MMLTGIATAIKLMLAAFSLGRSVAEGSFSDGAKAFADLLTYKDSLDKVLDQLGLKDFAATLVADAEQQVAGFRQSGEASAAECDAAIALFERVALSAVPSPDRLAALGLNQGAVLTEMTASADTNPDFAMSPLAQSLFI